MPRYVILHHEMPPDSVRATHWDFLVEQGDVLRAWALPESPRPGAVFVATQLADHRLAYLTYEGPISGGRGHVSRWDAGTCHWREDAPERVILDVRGTHLEGRVTLQAVDPPAWSFCWDSTEDS